VGHFYVKDNPQLFFSIFGTGDPLLIGYLVLAGVVDDTDLQMLDAKNLTPQLKHLMETREFLFYASITALIVSFISKLFSLSDTFTEHNIAKLILMMNVSLSGFLFCVCTAIWLKRSLLKLK